AAPGALPRVAGEVFPRLDLAPQEEVQWSAHLVLAEGEDSATRRRTFPARLLVGGAHGDAVAAHRARVDVFLNGRHLREARHSNPPFRYGVPRDAEPHRQTVLLRHRPAYPSLLMHVHTLIR